MAPFRVAGDETTVVRRITTLRPMTRAAASSAYRPEDYAGSSTGPRPRPADSESALSTHLSEGRLKSEIPVEFKVTHEQDIGSIDQSTV